MGRTRRYTLAAIVGVPAAIMLLAVRTVIGQDPPCNTIEPVEFDFCDASYAESTYCASHEFEVTCDPQGGNIGADGEVNAAGAKWHQECFAGNPSPDPSDHCIEDSPQHCLQKFFCDWSEEEVCVVGAAYSPEAYWSTDRVISPTCVPSGGGGGS